MTKTPLTRAQVQHQLWLAETLDRHLRVMETHLKGVEGARFRQTLGLHVADTRGILRRFRAYWHDRLHHVTEGDSDAAAPPGP